MIDIKISVSNVDYEAALDTLLPVLLEHLSKKTENAFLSSILSKTKGVSSIAVKAALKTLPQDTRDDLAVACLNHYKDDIQRLLTEASKQKGIALQIDGINIAVAQSSESA
ncbi:hypothetical protein [Hydrogeniiclostridium mannosilyticum]|uniref:hypothetical protein n=1 Tax=Hydrogeniiclostridium mannosilyticum TaxID=2764322 RepID=UPI0018AC74DE|nr:hypothetical protein [Hydrogeniiclostridium mannosilyticum]